MRFILPLTCALVATCAPLSTHAQVTCQNIGGFTYCSNGAQSQQLGNFRYWNDGTTEQRIGPFNYITPPPANTYQNPYAAPPIQPLYGQPTRRGY